MTNIGDLTGLSQPLTKLIETVGEGLGVLGNAAFRFDARKIKRIGEAEAEVEKEKIIRHAEAEATALATLDRAGKRFALEQYTKQINLENIIVKSQTLLEGESVDSRPVDKDWTTRFLGIAQDVGKDEMQEILAKILAGEVRSPDTYSLRLLSAIKDLSSRELSVFSQFVALSASNIGLFTVNGINRENLQRYGLGFSDYIELTEIGLLNGNTTLTIDIPIKEDDEFIVEVGDRELRFKAKPETQEFRLSLIRFTNAGLQLAALLKDSAISDYKDAYIKDLEAFIVQAGFESL